MPLWPPLSTFEDLFEDILYALLTEDRVYVTFASKREASDAYKWWRVYTGDRNIPACINGSGRLRIFSIQKDDRGEMKHGIHRSMRNYWHDELDSRLSIQSELQARLTNWRP